MPNLETPHGSSKSFAASVLAAISAEGASSEIAGLCSGLVKGTIPLVTLGSLATLTPAMAYVLLLGGTHFVQWRAGKRRDEELQSHYADVAEAIHISKRDSEAAVQMLSDIHSRSRFVWAKIDGGEKAVIAARVRDILRPLLDEMGEDQHNILIFVDSIKDDTEQIKADNKHAVLERAAIMASLEELKGRIKTQPEEVRDQLLSALQSYAQRTDPREQGVAALMASGDFAEAAAIVKEIAEEEDAIAAKLESESDEAKKRAVQRWVEAGNIAFVSNQETARFAYHKATELDPTNIYALSRLGSTLMALDRLTEARDAFTSAMRRLPGADDIWIRATDTNAARGFMEGFLAKNAEVTREMYTWVAREVVNSGLMVLEILRRKPELASNWIIHTVDPKTYEHRPPPLDSVTALLEERLYGLDGVLGPGGVQVEHRRCLERLSRLAFDMNQTDLAESYLARAKAMSVEQRDYVAEAAYLSNLGIVAGQRGDFETARSYLLEALTICCRGNPEQPAIAVARKPLSEEEEARRRNEDLPPQDDEIVVSNFLGPLFESNPQEAMKQARKLKQIEGSIYGNNAQLAIAEGNVDKAREYYLKSLDAHRLSEYARGYVMTQTTLGDMSWDSGDRQDACERWRHALHVCQQIEHQERSVEAIQNRLRDAGCGDAASQM